MSGRVVVERARAVDGYARGWLVMDRLSIAHVGTFAAAIHFATRLTTQPRQERQAMTTSPVIHPEVGVLDIQHVLALAERTVREHPSVLTGPEDRVSIDRVRDAANDAWLAL